MSCSKLQILIIVLIVIIIVTENGMVVVIKASCPEVKVSCENIVKILCSAVVQVRCTNYLSCCSIFVAVLEDEGQS